MFSKSLVLQPRFAGRALAITHWTGQSFLLHSLQLAPFLVAMRCDHALAFAMHAANQRRPMRDASCAALLLVIDFLFWQHILSDLEAETAFTRSEI